MASEVFNIAKLYMIDGTINLDTDADLKVTLLMTDQTVDQPAGKDAAAVSDLTLDECDSATFTFAHGGDGRKALTMSTAVDNPTDLAKATVDAPGTTTWASIAASTRQVEGALILKEGTSDDTDAYPIAWVAFPSNVTLNGGDLTINWNSEGAIQFA